jgi:hypothetical protein
MGGDVPHTTSTLRTRTARKKEETMKASSFAGQVTDGAGDDGNLMP